jgi:hypothetical protein
MPSLLILARRGTGAARPAHLGLHQAHLVFREEENRAWQR